MKSFFEGGFGKYVLPGIILQSVLIGGGYATGREIVEYGAKFGAWGWLSGLATFLGFAVVSVLSFELIRLSKVYDYKNFIRQIAGPLCHVFDAVYCLFMVLIIAVMSAATGSIVETVLGLNYWYGVVGITAIVGILHFYGEHLIERFETLDTVALYAGYLLFYILVISQRSDNIALVFASQDTSFVPDATVMDALWAGVLYMAYNLVVLPASFFTLKRQETRRQSVISGIIAGLLMTIPWFLTYFSVLGFYPDSSVVGAAVPWMVMMQACSASPWMLVVFGVVMGWTLIETSTGIIHALLDRVNTGLQEANRSVLTRAQRGYITIGVLVTSMIMSRVGIIDLIAKGYNALSYAFILIFLIPLLTVGVYKIRQKRKLELAAVPVYAETQTNPAAIDF